jgi:hypothetical protein
VSGNFYDIFCPLKLNALVKQICQRLVNLGEVLDKTAAIAGESEKTSDLFDILRGSPVKNSLNSFWVDSNTILGNHMIKVGHFG